MSGEEANYRISVQNAWSDARTAFRSAGGFSVVGEDGGGEMARAGCPGCCPGFHDLIGRSICGSSGAEVSGAGKSR